MAEPASLGRKSIALVRIQPLRQCCSLTKTLLVPIASNWTGTVSEKCGAVGGNRLESNVIVSVM